MQHLFVAHGQEYASVRSDFLKKKAAETERFASTPDFILESWQRSLVADVSPTESIIDWEETDPEHLLLRHSRKPLQQLVETLQGIDVGVVISDESSRILARYDTSSSASQLLDRIDLGPGYNYQESSIGTNGIGTVTATQKAVFISGSAHYQERFENYACAAAPIRHPITGETIGVLDLTCDVQVANPFLLSLAVQTSSHITHALREVSTSIERAALDAYVSTTQISAPGTAVIVQTQNIKLKNKTAENLMQPAERDRLVEQASQLLRNTDSASFDYSSSVSGRSFKITGRLISAGDYGLNLFNSGTGDSETGVLLCINPVFSTPQYSVSKSVALPKWRSQPRMKSSAWQLARRELERILKTGQTVLLLGEVGTGKTTLTRSLLESVRPGGILLEVDAGRGVPKTEIEAQLLSQNYQPKEAVILIRNVQECALEQLEEVAHLLRNPIISGTYLNIVLTADSKRSDAPELQRLLPYVQFMVTVPPLRERREDFSILSKHIIENLAPDAGIQLNDEALKTLESGHWPGNIAQLESVLGRAINKARGRGSDTVDSSDLDSVPLNSAEIKLTTIQVRERDAIVSTLHEFEGNRVLTAKHLGIARATLYRKMKAYGIS